MGTRFPTPLAIDPWWDLFLPALYGERDSVEEALVRVQEDPAALAVVVRTLALLGRGARAQQLWARVLGTPCDEVDSLAVLIGPDPDAALKRLLARCEDRGRVADAWCDRAARALVDGDLTTAGDAVATVVDGPVEHAEAARWARFFADCPDPIGVYRTAVSGTLGGERPYERDGRALAVRASQGWVSAERLGRRILGAPHAAPRPGTGLALLAAAGVSPGHFGLASEFARSPAADPRVELELLADLVWSLVEEGRDAVQMAAALYERAWVVGVEVGHDAARLLVSVASRDDRLLALGHGAATVLATDRVGDVHLWSAWQAALGRLRAPDASVLRARQLARDPAVSEEAWLVALDALRLCGQGEEARELARAASARPDRAASASYFLARGAAAPPRPARTRG
jgi:hypothetical protein